MNTIFVQIASYRDPQLIPTINSLLDNAEHPENLHICVCWQHGNEETTETLLDAGIDILGMVENVPGEHTAFSASYKGAKLIFIDVPNYESQGACWARNYIQLFYSGEKYTMQLDSHHRFVRHWDKKCIGMLENLRHKSAKPVLTAYLPSFNPETDPEGRVFEAWKMDFDRFIPEGAVFFIPSVIEDANARTEPLRARFYSAHFAFADGSFAVDVKHDPNYFFHGEEISIAARAFTHGYDLYHPHTVIAWHEYLREYRTKVWDDHTTDAKIHKKIKLDWVERNDLCHRRNRILFGMDGENPNQINFGEYGFGTERTLREYEEYAGISFKYRGVQQETLDHKDPVWPLEKAYANEVEWRSSLVKSHDIRILVHRSELGEIADDYDFWCVAAFDADGEVYRKDWLGNIIKKALSNDNEWVDERLIFFSNREPIGYTIWPHSVSKGWLTKIDKFELA